MKKISIGRLIVGMGFAAMVFAGAGLGKINASNTVDGAEQMRDYVFVYIKTGPTTDLTEEEQKEAFAGHFANMKRMASEGDLLIAGPLGEPKSDPDHRGLFVIDAEALDEGMAIASTDPTTKLGVFVLEGFVFTTDRPLTELPRLEKEAEAARLADPDNPENAAMRAYTLATAPFTEQRLEALSKMDGVLIAGKLHGSGQNESDEVLAWLDATDAEAAVALLPDDGGVGGVGGVGSVGGWTLHGWYGSGAIEHMRE